MKQDQTGDARSHLFSKMNSIDQVIADFKQPPAVSDPLGAAIDAAVLQISKALMERQHISNRYLRLLARSGHRDK